MIGPDYVRQLSIKAWLNSLGLTEYQDIFRRYAGVEDILGLTEGEIRKLGVRNGSHRARMVSSLVILKEKLTGGSHSNSPYLQRRELGQGPPQGDYSRAHQYASIGKRSGQLPQPPGQRSLDTHHPGGGGESLSEQQAVMENFQEMCRMGWYHGGIPRTKAEALVVHSGDYLVRDSSSQPGDFVLTVRWQGVVLHFVVNKQLKLNPRGQLVVLYQFEEETFESVPALIQFYADLRKQISKSSGATVMHPVTRNVSVDYYDRRPVRRGLPEPCDHHPYRGQQQQHYTRCGSHSANVTPTHSPAMARRSRHKRSGSQPLLSLDSDEDGCGSYEDLCRLSTRHGSMPMIGANLSRLVAASKIVDIDMEATLQQQQRSGSEPDLPMLKKTNRDTIYPPESSLSKSRAFTGSDGELSKQPPPKPSRTPTVRKSEKPRVTIRRPDLYEDDGKDYTDYDQVKSWSQIQKEKEEAEQRRGKDWTRMAPVYPPSDPQSGDGMDDYDVPKSNVPVVSNGNHGNPADGDYDVPVRSTLVMPSRTPRPRISTDTHTSGILTPENKPLETSALATMKHLFLGTSPEVLAQHLTWLDLDLLGLRGDASEFGFGMPSGLAMFTLPHGHQMRLDLKERYVCRQMLVSVMILICGKIQERAAMINQWMEIAQSLYNLVGNLYAFSAVMGALQCLQVKRLKNTWEYVREHHSGTLWTYETKLKGIVSSLDQASSLLPLQNVSVPHMMPVIELLERDNNNMMDLLGWEEGPDYGLDIALAHLDTARIISQHSALYQTTTSYMLGHLQPMADLLDALATETHIRLLWGARGAKVQPAERYLKFEQVLTVLSEKAESSQNPGSETSV